MKPILLEYLRCPSCGESLLATEKDMWHEEIRTGTLTCSGSCGFSAPIVNYIPRFVDRANYSHSWGKLWEETGAVLRDSFTGVPFHRNVVHGYHDESGEAKPGSSPFGFAWPEDLTGQRILEIGPGTGNCTEVLVETGAELVCVDMSHAIDTFPESMLTRPNINVIQGDITAGFLRPSKYDRIWLFQVLQHTPEPPKTLALVREFLAPGGELAVTSYKTVWNPWYYKYTKRIDDERAWRLIVALIPVAVRIKYGALRAADLIGSGRVKAAVRRWLEFIDPRNVYYRTLRGEMNDYIMGRMWAERHDKKLLMKYVIINTYDAITPTYTNNCPDLATMASWLRDAGYSRNEVWGTSGVRAKGWN